MSDYENGDEEAFESLEEYQEQEDEELPEEDADWSDSLDDMESDDWSEQFGRSNIDLEEVEDAEDFGDDEVDDLDLERIEKDYFDEEDAYDQYDREDFSPANRGAEQFVEADKDTLVDRYVDLKSRLRDIQAALHELQPRVVAALSESGVVVDDRVGKVRVAKRTQWSYSDDVVRLQAMIREKKKEEREQGIAVVRDEKAYVVVQPGGGQSE